MGANNTSRISYTQQCMYALFLAIIIPSLILLEVGCTSYRSEDLARYVAGEKLQGGKRIVTKWSGEIVYYTSPGFDAAEERIIDAIMSTVQCSDGQVVVRRTEYEDLANFKIYLSSWVEFVNETLELPAAGALGYWFGKVHATGEIYQATIWINKCVQTERVQTIAHELLHSLGLQGHFSTENGSALGPTDKDYNFNRIDAKILLEYYSSAYLMGDVIETQ